MVHFPVPHVDWWTSAGTLPGTARFNAIGGAPASRESGRGRETTRGHLSQRGNSNTSTKFNAIRHTLSRASPSSERESCDSSFRSFSLHCSECFGFFCGVDNKK